MNYWIIIDNTPQGPYTPQQLSEMNLTAHTPVWHEGLTDWLPACKVDEIAGLLTPAAPAITMPTPAATVAPATPAPIVQAAPVTPTPAAPTAVPVTPAVEPKSPPTYLVWAIITTIVCFLPMGVCAIICAAKVSSHYKAGRLEKASRMSERAALFVILSIVAWLIWIPFSVVFAML